ncbi:MAG TPA: signal recognition particle-docking protein FtsY [Candidatus Avimonas sp.]|nr:signal recognition particle-docking protein FtsY [Clostridiales bacterium]HOB36553.1 signal recognition particle-docking protein FtsY [Candidatus Avimonas sp.]HQA15445.1 signal recognition particle-docking protein FtsY [Candidatus Avimonas sp.]HQD37669.1 signal recognition particle-docking protein FtsY [Candidatus Avimonas sp.]
MGLFSKIGSGLKKTRDSLMNSVNSVLRSFVRIDSGLFEELEEILITADVGAATSARICDILRQKVRENGVTDPAAIKGLLAETVSEMLMGGQEMSLSTVPSVILVIGVNGVGKTTSIGKLAAMYRSAGKKVILSAADTFRAAAIEQLDIWAKRAGADIVKHAQGADPAAVVFDTIAAAKSRRADLIICDTAGRLHNKKNLMDELSKINRVIDRELPGADKEVLLVVDATTGQNAVNQAREFKNAAGITGIILTKLDGTAKGGVVLAIREDLDVPVKFIGVGEGIDDLEPFDPAQFAAGLFHETMPDEDL